MPPDDRLRPHKRPLPEQSYGITERGLESCQNLGLILDKFQPWDFDRQNGWELRIEGRKEGAKGKWLANLTCGSRIDEELFKYWVSRSIRLVKDGGSHRLVCLISQSRLVVGLGAKGTLEMGLTLHPRYGFPFIPGSALKGLARTAALYELAQVWEIPQVSNMEFKAIKKGEDDTKTPLNKLEDLLWSPRGSKSDPKKDKELQIALRKLKKDPFVQKANAYVCQLEWKAIENDSDYLFWKIRKVFGDTGNAGVVVFYDALPAQYDAHTRELTPVYPKLVVEITTSHFPKYYTQNGLPQDCDKPNPAPFLAITEGTAFTFALGVRHNCEAACLIPAWGWLDRGLRELGIGGKTSSGLGIFGNDSPPSSRKESESQAPQDLNGYLKHTHPKHLQKEEQTTPETLFVEPSQHSAETLNMWLRLKETKGYESSGLKDKEKIKRHERKKKKK